MMLWQVHSGSPTRLVPLMDMIWSPMFSLPERSAGPACIMLAIMTVGRMEPQPLSTMTTPRMSPLAFSMDTWGHSTQENGKSVFESANDSIHSATYVFAVLRLREVDEVIVVHVLSVEQVTVLLLAQVLGVNAVGSQELLVSHTEGLPDGLGDQLGLDDRTGELVIIMCIIEWLLRRRPFWRAKAPRDFAVGLTSSDSNTWHIILYCRLLSWPPSEASTFSWESGRGCLRRAIRTTMLPMSAM